LESQLCWSPLKLACALSITLTLVLLLVAVGASFPMDNLCANDKPPPPVFWGSHTITTLSPSPEIINVTVEPTDVSYRYCNQDLFRSGGRSFPFIPSQQPPGGEWMTDDQVVVTTVYGWAAVGSIVLAILMFVQGWIEQIKEFVWGESTVRFATFIGIFCVWGCF
jgi:hypothetical protein